jgi:protein TonB
VVVIGGWPRMDLAIMISTIVHAAVLMPLSVTASREIPAPKKDILVDYVKLSEPPKEKAMKRDADLKMPDRPKVDLRPKVDSSPGQKVEKAEVARDKGVVDDEKAARTKIDADRAELAAQARARATKDYINYYQLIREKIKRNVRRRYRDRSREGEVRLNFVLNSDGSLAVSEVVGGASDEELASIALASLREAAPFPRFPKDLSLARMSFTVEIIFKR